MGWSYKVWSGADLTVLRNVRFLAAGRRRHAVEEGTLVKVAEAGAVGMTLAQAKAGAEADPAAARRRR